MPKEFLTPKKLSLDILFIRNRIVTRNDYISTSVRADIAGAVPSRWCSKAWRCITEVMGRVKDRPAQDPGKGVARGIQPCRKQDAHFRMQPPIRQGFAFLVPHPKQLCANAVIVITPHPRFQILSQPSHHPAKRSDIPRPFSWTLGHEQA
jgi:hypothetical protein